MDEHKMVRVERSAVKSAKRLCMIVLVVAIPLAIFYLQSPPATKALIDAYDTWPCVIVGVVLAIVAIRAAFSR
jgi:hypothetical protein